MQFLGWRSTLTRGAPWRVVALSPLLLLIVASGTPAMAQGFLGYYAPGSNWRLTGDARWDYTGGITSLVIGPSVGGGDATITIPKDGDVSFDWTYLTGNNSGKSGKTTFTSDAGDSMQTLKLASGQFTVTTSSGDVIWKEVITGQTIRISNLTGPTVPWNLGAALPLAALVMFSGPSLKGRVRNLFRP